MQPEAFISLLCIFTALPIAARGDTDPCRVKENTYYTLTNKLIGNLFLSEGGLAISTDPSNSDLEKFSFQKVPFARQHVHAYAIISKLENLALTEWNWTFVTTTYHANTSQMFHLVPTSDGHCAFQVVSSEKFVGADQEIRPQYPKRDNASVEGSYGMFTQYVSDKEEATHWKINEVFCDPYPYQPYRLLHRHTDSVAGIASGKVDDGEPLTLISIKEKSYHAQVTFENETNFPNLYHIILRHSDKEFNVANGSMEARTPVIQYTKGNGSNSKWHVETAYEHWCSIKAFHSQRYISPNADWELLQFWNYQFVWTEHFGLELIGFAPDPNKLYRIRNAHSNLYLGVNSATRQIIQDSYESSVNQLWTFIQVGEHKYQYHLRVREGGSEIIIDSQNEVHQFRPTNLEGQLFEIKEAKSTKYARLFRIEAPRKNLVLATDESLLEGLDENPKVVAVRADEKSAAQLWEIEVDVAN